MDDLVLQPWMLNADWRDDERPLLIVDLAAWPAKTPLDPLPPVPVIATGPQDHPRAAEADVLADRTFSAAALAAAVQRTPRAAAILIQLLRATEGLAPERALIAESFAFATLQAGREHDVWLGGNAEQPAAPGVLHMARRGARLDLTIDRPQARNAIDRALRDALYEAFALAVIDDGIEQIRLRSVGRSFSIGADLAEFGTTRDAAEAHAIRMRTLPALPMIRRAERYDIHIQGACVGSGLELAAFAGRVTAAPDAWFQLPEVSMGILPGFGGTVSIPRRIGRQRAAALMLSGRRINAAHALRWGLVDAIVDEPPADPDRPHEVG